MQLELIRMTLSQFDTIDEQGQLETISENGVVVAEQEDEVNRYKLYQIGAFYVEEEWHKKYNVRSAFYSIASTNAEKLEPQFG